MANSENQTANASPAPKIIAGLVIVGVGLAIQSFVKAVGIGGLEINFGESVSMIGMIIVMFPVIQLFYTTPLANAIGERNANLEHTFSEAENLKVEMQKLRTDYEARLAKTEADARDQIQAEVKSAQALRASITAEATAKADELVRKAQEEISQEKARAITEIRTHVVDLTLQASAKVVGENMDNDRNRRLIQDFINGIEVKA